jgi:hypothetical protein
MTTSEEKYFYFKPSRIQMPGDHKSIAAIIPIPTEDNDFAFDPKLAQLVCTTAPGVFHKD